MKLRDLKIGTQLRIGMGAILLLTALLGATAWFQADSLWQETRNLYEHPLKVQRAIGEIRVNFLTVNRGMRDLFLAGNDQEIQTVIQEIDTYEANAARQLEILYDRYLGPRVDIDHVHDAAVQWRSIRAETIQLLRAGKTAEAADRMKPSGVSSVHLKKLISEIKYVSDFSLTRSEQFYADAQKHKDALMVRLVIILGAIFLLTTGVGYLLFKGIRDPLKELTSAAQEYRQGNLDARSHYLSTNEFGALAASFNALAQAVQMELRSKEDLARIADIMLREDDLRAFCLELLKALLEHTGSRVGAVYLLNEQKTDFMHFESIGLAPAGRTSFSTSGREGEFGAALATRQIQHITDIPPDTRFTFAAVSGDFIPREIMTIPILSQQDVVGVVSLASLRSYPASSVRLINEVWSVLTARLNGVLALRKILDFSEKLEHQNQELEAQKTELTMQKDEMSEQNIELELQKKQLDDANRLKSTFLSNMSHELRTPLNSVIALSGVLRRRLADTIPEEEHGYLEVIERNGQNLLALINDILDLSRIEAGREDISLSHFSARELAVDVVAMIEPQALEKNIALLNSVGEELPTIRSDFTKCRHILQNLVANAVKFTREGNVEISAHQVDGAVEIAVTDTGIGIAADKIPYIFDEFRQADDSTTKNYGGTGLGLSIARKYALLLRGNIAVKSTPGKGSTFTFRVPLRIDAPTTGESELQTSEYSNTGKAVESSAPPAGQGKCILVVEDNVPAVIQLRDILVGHGYEVRVAGNGREALEQIEKTLPDAMILDLMMPEVDGFEVLRAIRSVEKTAHIPVLILTAKHVTREELSLLQGGRMHQLVQKGNINRRDLLTEIGKMVAPRRALQLPPTPTPARRRPSGKPVILVVEDNPDNRLTVRALLRDTCTVIEAADGREGVEQAGAHTPDLILMDISLPVMDGFQALDAIKDQDALRHIPVIALTASAMKGNREEIVSYGFDGYISKPIDRDLLEETITEKLYGSQEPDDIGD
jgi:signal transduction histidine kinase/DNA-binding response OmpR family regulator/HAMP domain-containing protein